MVCVSLVWVRVGVCWWRAASKAVMDSHSRLALSLWLSCCPPVPFSIANAGAAGSYWCDPPGPYVPDFRAERFRPPYAFAPYRPVAVQQRPARTVGFGGTVDIVYGYSDGGTQPGH